MTHVVQQTITSNNETFTIGTYNGIKVIIHDSDGYVNGNSITKQFGKDFYRINEHRGWGEFYDEMKHVLGSSDFRGTMIYEIRKGHTNEVRGQYVHPKLVNYIAMWASPRYAVYVSEIMDTINDYTHAANTTFDAAKDELITQYQSRIDELQKRNQELQQQNMTLETTQEALSSSLYTTSTRTPGNDKHLYIIDSLWGLQLSANSSRKPSSYHRHYVFPASMHVKQLIRKHFKSDKVRIQTHYIIPASIYQSVLDYIETLNPLLSE